MPSESDDDSVMRSSTEHYDRVGVSFRWPQILASASSIFFGFLLDIVVNPPSYFAYTDSVIVMTALYCVAVATAMFIMPVIYHMTHYRKFDVDNFLSRNKQYVLTGIICVMKSHDNEILLASLYAVTIATTMFLTPVIYHGRHYRKLDVEGFLLWAKKPVRVGIACVMLSMYLALGLAFSSSAKIPNPIAYSVAALPFLLSLNSSDIGMSRKSGITF